MTTQRVAEAIRVADAWRATKAEQPRSLFDEVDEAIESATCNAGEAWRERALVALRRLAESRETFTAPEVWPLITDRPPYERRAMGGIVREGARRRWIEPDGFTPGGVAEHGRPLRVWRSLLHATEPPEGGPVHTTSRSAQQGSQTGGAMS